MTKNLKGGKHKHTKKNTTTKKDVPLVLVSELPPGHLYGMIVKNMGTAFEIECSNGKTERALIRGKMRKRVWLNKNDVVLVDNTELGTFYIIDKYTPDQVKQLKAKGEITFNIKDEENNDIAFRDGEDESASESESDDEIFKELDKKKLTQNRIKELDTKITSLQDEKQSLEIEEELRNQSQDEEQEDQLEQESKKSKVNTDKLVNVNKLAEKYKNKARGGRDIIRERGRTVARDRKGKGDGLATRENDIDIDAI